MRIFITAILLTILFNAKGQELVKTIKFNHLESLMTSESESIKVINFWATWCKPCIEELPEFEKANLKKGVEVYLVSMDFVEDLSKVKKFVEKKGLKSNILLLDDIAYDDFMPRVNKKWSGSIPATLFVDGKTGDKLFFEKQFKDDELMAELNNFIGR